jgi:hypothetical protein
MKQFLHDVERHSYKMGEYDCLIGGRASPVQRHIDQTTCLKNRRKRFAMAIGKRSYRMSAILLQVSVWSSAWSLTIIFKLLPEVWSNTQHCPRNWISLVIPLWMPENARLSGFRINQRKSSIIGNKLTILLQSSPGSSTGEKDILTENSQV